MEIKDLVSVVVVTYNSSQTVIETLDSIKRQSYPAIELIISDDYSSDETVTICDRWLDKNANRFWGAHLIRAGNNTGVCGNLNRGIHAVQGKWVKALAADDLLCDDAIEKYVRFCEGFKCDICVSDAFLIDEDGNSIDSESKSSIWPTFLDSIGQDLKSQMKQVQLDKLCPGPPMFFSKKAWDAFGGYDEKYRFADEWAMQYGMVMNGYAIFPIKEKLIYYRCSPHSLCHNSLDNRSNTSQLLFARKKVIPFLLKKLKIISAWDVFIRRIAPYLMIKYQINSFKYLLLFSPTFVCSKLKTKNK